MQATATQPVSQTNVASDAAGAAVPLRLEGLPEVGPANVFPARPLDGQTFEFASVPPPGDPMTGDTAGNLSLDTVLSPYVAVFIVAFLMAYAFTPIMRVVAVAYNIVDQPDKVRKLHTRPVAYLGGVAVFLGFFAALAVSQVFTQNHNPFLNPDQRLIKIPAAFLASTFVVAALGFIDDIRGVRPRIKILGQLAAAATLFFSGIGDTIAKQPVANFAEWLHLDLGIPIPAALEGGLTYLLSAVLVAALVVFCCNASNLMDGLDGLCGGITAIIALGLIFVATHLAMHGTADSAGPDAVRLVIVIALLGGVLGFLPYNFNPASIFMGDTGSLLLGFIVAASIISLGEAGTKWMMGGLVMFSLPVLDTALAFARRYVNKRPFFSADRHHFHHQLVSRGLTVRRAVVVSYALTIFFVACGCLLIFLRTRYVVAFYLWLFGCIIVAAYKMGMVHERPAVARKRGHLNAEPATTASDDRADAA